MFWCIEIFLATVFRELVDIIDDTEKFRMLESKCVGGKFELLVTDVTNITVMSHHYKVMLALNKWFIQQNLCGINFINGLRFCQVYCGYWFRSLIDISMTLTSEIKIKKKKTRFSLKYLEYAYSVVVSSLARMARN